LAFDLLVILGAGALLALVLFFGFKAIALLPLSQDRRKRLARVYPPVMITVTLCYVLFAVSMFFSGFPELLPFALLVTLIGLSSLFWSFARDVLAGIFLRAEGACQLGRTVRVGDFQGKIAFLGPRSLGLETQGGDVVVWPYGKLSHETIVQTSGAEQLAARTFSVGLPAKADAATLSKELQEAALRCHWAAIGREPLVRAFSDRLELTVYAVDSAHLGDVESAVRDHHAELIS
jgi:small-conductance mechanosensitive channel